jgi:hypothetical protein
VTFKRTPPQWAYDPSRFIADRGFAVAFKRLVLVVLLVLVGSGCSGGDDEPDAIDQRLDQLAGAGVYVGGVAYTNTLVAVHFERQDDDRVSMMRMFVTDGVPGGNAEWFEGRPDGGGFRFTSAGGRATIEGTYDMLETEGTVTLADGVNRVFFTRPAGHAAGIFEINIDGAGKWSGRSLDGSTLEAQQRGTNVEGFVRAQSGEQYDFRQNDLSRRLGYSREGGQPDNYTLIVTRQATEIMGRGGDVRRGRPSENIVALDLGASDVPSAGEYYGRVAMTTDKLAISVRDEGGVRRLRGYLSDAEPEPGGDIQWFTALITGNIFTITSAMGDARIDGTVSADGITGNITLPGQPARPYYAAPAGDGAGIYDVTVRDDRSHVGTSDDGGRLELTYRDGLVMGKVMPATGPAIDLLGADLAEAYKYGIQASVPGTYVAFAAPRARFLIGRNGDVRGGSAGLNIIGLDKKC